MKAWWVTILLVVGFATSARAVAQHAGGSFWAKDFRTGEVHRPRMARDRYAFATLGVSTPRRTHGEQGQDRGSQRLYRLGFNVQMPQDGGNLQYGPEMGLNLDYQSSYNMYSRVADEHSTASVRSDLWLADASLGAFLSARPSTNVRLYLSGGPALYWGRQGGGITSYSEALSTPGGTIRHDRHSGRSSWQLGSYIQAGAKVTLSRGTSVGFNIRQDNVTLNFGNPGEVDHSVIRMNSPQYAVTLGYRF